MATAEFRGYCNRPESKESSKGGFSKFTLGVSQKNKGRNGAPDTKSNYYVDCVDFKNSQPPPDGAYVTVSGYLEVKEYESKSGKNAGKTMQGLSLSVQSLEIAPPKEGSKAAVAAGDPFSNDIPF